MKLKVELKTKNNFKFFFILITFVFLNNLNAYYVHNYTDKDGLSMNIGLTIEQDRKGYIWIGTQQGLNRFDGVNVETFTKKDGLPDNFINYLYSDSEGKLWIATRNGLALYDSGKFKTYKIKNASSLENIIYCIAESPKYGLLIGTEVGLFTIKGGNLINYEIQNKYFNKKIKAIVVYNNNIYLGSPEIGLISVSGNSVKLFFERDGLINRNINTFLVSEDGLWIGTDAGLTLFKDDKFSNKITNENTPFLNYRITALFEDKKGYLWIASAEGLYFKKKNKIYKHLVNGRLTGNNLLSLCHDHEDGIWIGAHGGVSYLGKSKFNSYTQLDGLPQNMCFDIYPARDGKIWIATYGGIAVINDCDENYLSVRTLTTEDGLPSNMIRTITGDNDGSIWIGTFGGGLVRHKDNHLVAYNRNNGLLKNDVRVVYIDKNDDLWLGMNDGGLVLFNKKNGKVKELYNTDNGLLNDNVWFIKEDSDNNLWIGVDGGLCKFDPKTKEFLNTYSIDDGFYCKNPHDICEDKDGFWIATFGDGLYYLDKDQSKRKRLKKFNTKTTNDLFPDNCVYAVIPDKKGYLWLPTNKGICRFDKNDQIDKYTVFDGLPSNENDAHGGVIDIKDRIWFSTPKGVAWIHSENFEYNEKPPPVYIEKLIVDKLPLIPNGNNIILNPNPQNIRIDFTALSFQFPEAIKFKVWLDGFQATNDPVEIPSKIRYKDYTNLSPGNYTFRVTAANNDGVWSEKEAKLTFKIKPSFFQTIWLYIFLLFVVLFLFYGFYRYRIIQQENKRKQLEREVEKRTKERDQMRESLFQQKRMALLGEQAAKIAHEINNPTNYIFGNLDIFQDFTKDIKRILEKHSSLDVAPDHKIIKLSEKLEIERKIKKIDRLLENAKDGVKIISNIIDDLRYFAKSDEGKLQLINIHKNIETTLALLNNILKDRIEVKKQFGNIPQIQCYSSQLIQVFMNLIANAAEAILEKGTITIKTQMKDENNFVIEISDTGEGINSKLHQKIFDPFFTTKNSKKNSGLGLYIAHQIIQRHGGSIIVESEVGKGTKFVISLPIKQKKSK